MARDNNGKVLRSGDKVLTVHPKLKQKVVAKIVSVGSRTVLLRPVSGDSSWFCAAEGHSWPFLEKQSPKRR